MELRRGGARLARQPRANQGYYKHTTSRVITAVAVSADGSLVVRQGVRRPLDASRVLTVTPTPVSAVREARLSRRSRLYSYGKFLLDRSRLFLRRSP